MDIIGDATPERYALTVDACLQDAGVDGAVVILTPQAMTRPREVAEVLVDLAEKHSKPIVTTWMGGKQVEDACEILSDALIPNFQNLENAVDAFSYLAA